MSDIPKARKMLSDLARCAEADGQAEYARVINEVIPLLWRSQHKRKKSAVHSARATPELRAQIREYVEKNPNVPSQHVAIHFGVNLGLSKTTLKQSRGVTSLKLNLLVGETEVAT